MHYIEYNGRLYRSWRQACEVLGINYQNMRRLCRHYVRAERNPTIAIDWLTGKSQRAINEQRTFKYDDDEIRRSDRRFERIQEAQEAFSKGL